ncbi:MAG TPA: family 20 glycosylhydrolase, partial [Planctomycetota bacterium]|nr:family 20 glycosylhydrolase [Planctomycetota bacterium]
ELPHALFPDAYCPSNPESYRLFFDVLDELIDIMRPTTVHIGHDEWRAAGLCPKCRKVHPGKLFARDVIRIYRHLEERGIATWMWADHFVSGHNERGRSWRSREGVWFDHPYTTGAWRAVAKACPKIVLVNWSWGLLRDGATRQGVYDAELREKGFRFLYGNFRGLRFEDWEERAKRHKVLGAEISSWSAMEEFELGKMHVADALSSIHFLWCEKQPPREKLVRRVMSLLPAVREKLSGRYVPPVRLTPERQHALDLSRHFNTKLRGKSWDLRGLRLGRFTADGLACRLGNGAVVVGRPRPGKSKTAVEIPVGKRFARLVFIQSATDDGRRPVHAGDSTFFPHESSELLGVYDVCFDDGLVLEAEVRYAENVGVWNAGLKGVYYHARNIVAGTLPDGSPLVVWGHEWVNPRPDVPIRAIRFRGTSGGPAPASKAQPLLLGITGVEKVKLRDYRTAAELRRGR